MIGNVSRWLILLLLLGCNDAKVEPVLTPGTDPRTSMTAPVDLTLALEYGPGLPIAAGPLRLLAINLDDQSRIELELARGSLTDAPRFPIRLPEGPYQLTVFHDRRGNSTFEPCPFPPQPDGMLYADSVDNIHGIAQSIRVHEGDIHIVQIERHLCGPGNSSTGLSGVLKSPIGVDLSERAIFAQLSPYDESTLSPHTPPIQIPLAPNGFSDQIEFSFGELIPGDYLVTLYVDDDGNARPTPCGPRLGGGDRYLTPSKKITISPGERLDLDTIRLTEADGCLDTLTGLRGRIVLDPTLFEALAQLGFEDLAAMPLRIMLTGTNDDDVVAQAPLHLLPHRLDEVPFTITGLPLGMWRVTIWLDLDQDGVFTPCDGLPRGLDLAFHVRDTLSIEAARIVSMGSVSLTLETCGEAITALEGGLTIEHEEGPVGSGRPVRLELYPTDEGGERRSILLFKNHLMLVDDVLFGRVLDVPPGEYRGRIYLDFDRDGEYRSCIDDPYGDRATSPMFTIEIKSGQRLQLNPLHIENLGCAIPPASILPQIEAANEPGVDGASAALRLKISEQGGWHSEFVIDDVYQPHDESFISSQIQLAPGHYQLTAFLDADDDQILDECDSERPDPWRADSEVSLDVTTPTAQPLLFLEPSCWP